MMGYLDLGQSLSDAGCLALLVDESEAYRLLEGPKKKLVWLSWLMRVKHTDCWKGQRRSLSCSTAYH